MPTAAQVVAQHLVNRGTCVKPPGTPAQWPVYVSRMPDAVSEATNPPTDNTVAVFDSGDLITARDMPGNNPLRHNCQVMVRAKDYPTGEARGRQIITDLWNLAEVGAEVVTVSGTPVTVAKVILTIGLTFMGYDKDQKNLCFFTINCRLTYGA